ncbi:MAG: YegP family protein [Bacteroidetes bacterium]|nr:YegP family protein [Bacteroidota bacterium]
MAGRFELRRTSNDQFRFNLVAANGEIILTSETYVHRQGAENGIESVRNNARHDQRFERKVAVDGSPYFVLKAGNGEIIGNSEMYSSHSAMEHGIASVQHNAPAAPLHDLTV